MELSLRVIRENESGNKKLKVSVINNGNKQLI